MRPPSRYPFLKAGSIADYKQLLDQARSRQELMAAELARKDNELRALRTQLEQILARLEQLAG